MPGTESDSITQWQLGAVDQGVLARHQASTRAAPADLSAWAAVVSVAPVVTLSVVTLATHGAHHAMSPGL